MVLQNISRGFDRSARRSADTELLHLIKKLINEMARRDEGHRQSAGRLAEVMPRSAMKFAAGNQKVGRQP
jgi:hypothetical protein